MWVAPVYVLRSLRLYKLKRTKTTNYQEISHNLIMSTVIIL